MIKYHLSIYSINRVTCCVSLYSVLKNAELLFPFANQAVSDGALSQWVSDSALSQWVSDSALSQWVSDSTLSQWVSDGALSQWMSSEPLSEWRCSGPMSEWRRSDPMTFGIVWLTVHLPNDVSGGANIFQPPPPESFLTERAALCCHLANSLFQ